MLVPVAIADAGLVVLAAVFGLPIEWYGAWFAGSAALVYLAAGRLADPPRESIRIGAEALGCAALIAAHIAAGVGGDQVPAAVDNERGVGLVSGEDQIERLAHRRQLGVL